MLAFIELTNDFINSIVWGPMMIVLLVGTGIVLTVRTGFFPIMHINIWVKATFGKIFSNRDKSTSNNITPFQAMTTAVASTVGTGNIVGVATAIVAGGPGAIFWMWVSAFFGMMTKYAEILLAVKYRQKDANGSFYGGPMYYIEKGLGKKYRWLAVLFSFFGALAGFGIGNVAQANSIASTVHSTFGISPYITGVILMIVVSLVILGGIKRIAKVTEKLVPFMAVFYFIGCIAALVMNYGEIPRAFSLIFSSAFSVNAAVGGVAGYGISSAIRYGFSRGVFSNEAGLGSAPIAHATAETESPVAQGLWGIFEVFIDTIVLCTMTSLVILTSGVSLDGSLQGADLTTMAFSQSFTGWGSLFLSIGIIFFALSTMLGWSYYGEQCIQYLSHNNKKAVLIYKFIFIGIIIFGCVGGLKLVWDIADTLNGLMAIPNLVAIIGLSGIVVKLTKNHIKKC